MLAAAFAVARRRGKKQAIKMMKIAGRSPIPNQSMANGAQARGDIGLKNWMSGLRSGQRIDSVRGIFPGE
jgi:hypothetical protein